MLVNLDFNFKDLDGNDVNANAAKTLADALCGTTNGISPAKAYDWALSFQRTGKVELDQTDLDLLKSFIMSFSFLNFVKVQLSQALDKIEKKGEKKDAK